VRPGETGEDDPSPPDEALHLDQPHLVRDLPAAPAAVRDIGTGHVVTTEMNEHKIATGAGRRGTVLAGDARETPAEFDRAPDFVLFDGVEGDVASRELPALTAELRGSAYLSPVRCWS
jgi:hypothetical protein